MRAFESVPRAGGGEAIVAGSGRPSPRLASVKGQTPTVPPRRRISSASSGRVCVQVDGGQSLEGLETFEQESRGCRSIGLLAVGDLSSLLLEMHVEDQVAPPSLGVEVGDFVGLRRPEAVRDSAE